MNVRNIVVNGRLFRTTSRELSYQTVVAFAFDRVPGFEASVYTVTYVKAEGERSGSLTPEQSVRIAEGTSFSVTVTSNV